MPAEGLPPELRATVYTFFSFTTQGAATAYAGIWFMQQGLDASQIGIINSVPIVILLLLNLFVGRIADRARDWRQVIIAGAVLSGLFSLGLIVASGFWGLLIVWTLINVPTTAVGPVMDAATMRMTRRNGTDYGFIRAWGTVGYTAVVALTGTLMVWFGPAAFVPWLVGLAVLRGVLALQLPQFRAPKENGGAQPAAAGATHILQVMKPWFLLPLIGWSFVYGTHIILDGFAGILWKAQGIGEDVIGWLFALGAIAEAAMMFAYRFVAPRFKARHLILASAVVMGTRLVIMAFAPPLWLLIIMQCFHAITFAMGFMGCVHFITNWTSENIAAEAQSFFTVLQRAMSIVALLMMGWLVGSFGVQAYIGAGVFSFIGAALIWSSLKLQPKAASTVQPGA
jgi:PPP family 3-phenylpropionic acid transporter